MERILLNKKRIAAFVSFIGACGWGVILIILGVSDTSLHEISGKEFLCILALYFPILSTVLYTRWTNFGRWEQTELEKLEYENKILQQKIEQRILNEKLNGEIFTDAMKQKMEFAAKLGLSVSI